MKLTQWYGIAGGCALFLGGLFFLYLQEVFVIYIPLSNNYLSTDERATQTTKKRIQLYYWNGQAHISEAQDIMWSSSLEDNINHLIQQLMLILSEERLINEKISLQSVIISPSKQDLYLSFNNNFLNANQSIYTKLMIIECIKKTLYENIIQDILLHILVNHKPLQDPHLDCSQGWTLEPISF